jgi:hypothetical protein
MELFIPSLVVIVLGAIVVFFILPKAAPYTLGAMAALLFGVGVFQHYSTFPYEYKSASLRDMMKDYSPFLMLLATILGLVIGIMVAFGGNPPSISESMPDMAGLATMPVSLPSIGNMGSNVFGGGNSTAKNNSKNSLMANMGMGGNVKRNNVASTSFKVT